MSDFWERADQSNGSESCWRWLGYIDRETGYGRVARPGGGDRVMGAHQRAYELSRGPIPTWLELDHLCRNRACVNPAHLEAVTHLENVRRGNGGLKDRIKTHCFRGHPFDEANTYINRASRYGSRQCRACVQITAAARKAQAMGPA